MENQNQGNVPGQQTINIQVPSADNIASRRSLIPLLFAIAIIFFFFNFFTVSCGGQKFESVKGINLVTGTQLKSQDMFSGGVTNGEKIPSSVWAVIAFGAAIIGLGAFLIKEKREAVIGTGTGAIGFGAMLILNFAVKNAIEKKAAGAPIEVDFQFAYWGALIAMGIAGFISYLRMQKTHNVVAAVAPPSNLPNDNNPTQPETFGNTSQQSSNFDIGEWFGKNIKIIIGVLSICAVLWVAWYLILKPNPVKDAKNAAAAYCDCSTKYIDAIIAADEEFIKSFNNYSFNKRQEARNKLQELQNKVISEFANCNNFANQKYNEKRNKFIANKELLKKFDFAYSAQSSSCKPSNQSKLTPLYSDIEAKIVSIKDPLPDIEKIKTDLLGHKIFMWNFEALSEFNQATIQNVNENSNYAEFNIKLHLVGYLNPETDIHDAEMLVSYRQSNEGWTLSDIKPIYYTQNYIAPSNGWATINFSSLPRINYTISHNGQKFWIKDNYYGTKYKGGPDGDQYHLSSSEIYIMSREIKPITLTFKFTPNN
jgi:hypothetical protein